SRSSTRPTPGPAVSGRPPHPTRPRSACSPTLPPTSGPAPPTSRYGRSSAPPGSPGPCTRSSATTAAATSPKPSWKPASGTGCPTRARPARAGSASSSPSGSTPPTRAAAALTSPPSPGPGWPVRASTTAAEAAPCRARASGSPAAGHGAFEPGDGLALGRCVRALADRQRVDRAVEPVAARAADPRALQRAVRRVHQVAVLYLGGQSAPDGTGLVHISRAVKKHHAGIHREPPFPRFAGACRTDDAARPPGRAGLPLTPLQFARAPLLNRRAGPRA